MYTTNESLMVMMIPVCARKCISTFFFLEEEILAYRVSFLCKALPWVICHFREWAPTNPPPGASHSNYGTKKLFGRGGLVRKRVRLEKTTPTQSFYKYLHSQSTTLAGAGYIRKEGRKPRGREKSRRNREKKEGVHSSWNKKETLTKSKPSSLLVAPHAIFF